MCKQRETTHSSHQIMNSDNLLQGCSIEHNEAHNKSEIYGTVMELKAKWEETLHVQAKLENQPVNIRRMTYYRQF